jgi:hypothetical protein
MNISDMASFENNNRWTSSPTDIPKFPIKRLEPSATHLYESPGPGPGTHHFFNKK